MYIIESKISNISLFDDADDGWIAMNVLDRLVY